MCVEYILVYLFIYLNCKKQKKIEKKKKENEIEKENGQKKGDWLKELVVEENWKGEKVVGANLQIEKDLGKFFEKKKLKKEEERRRTRERRKQGMTPWQIRIFANV